MVRPKLLVYMRKANEGLQYVCCWSMYGNGVNIKVNMIQCFKVEKIMDGETEREKEKERKAFTVGTSCTHLSCCVVASVTELMCVFWCVCAWVCVCVCFCTFLRERERERDYAGSQKRE